MYEPARDLYDHPDSEEGATWVVNESEKRDGEFDAERFNTESRTAAIAWIKERFPSAVIDEDGATGGPLETADGLMEYAYFVFTDAALALQQELASPGDEYFRAAFMLCRRSPWPEA